MDTEAISIIIGAILLLVAVLGGGIEIKELKIPKVGNIARGLSGVIGIGFVVMGLWVGGLFVEQDPGARPSVVVEKKVSTETKKTSPDTVSEKLSTPLAQREIKKPSLPKADTRQREKSVPSRQSIKQGVAQKEKPKSTEKSIIADAIKPKTVPFTIKARLGKTDANTELESAIRIYLGGNNVANFELSLTSPSQSSPLTLKPGKYNYYIEGFSQWDNASHPRIPLEGSGTIVVDAGSVYEVWAERVPSPRTKVWEVKLKAK